MSDLNSVIQLRRELHQHPELSGAEAHTARRIIQFYSELAPDALIKGLGGHGVAVAFCGSQPGPTVLLRCELDALPIRSNSQSEHRSVCPSVSHQCGHDGHMAILAALGIELAARRPANGRVVFLYQPAEETGKGAAAILGDPRFAEIAPDFAFALHNLPGFPLGQIVIRTGTFACASRGMSAKLTGTPAHAAHPEKGISPAGAMCAIVQQLDQLRPGRSPQHSSDFATVVGSRLGVRAFGTAPCEAEIWVTLRSETDQAMAWMIQQAETIVHKAAGRDGLRCAIDYDDVFPACVNSAAAVDLVCGSAGPAGVAQLKQPLRWSEDFGHFTAICQGALFGIGAGQDMPDLHSQDYEFPDQLTPLATNVLLQLIRRCLALARSSR